jgi:Domain of unknown function (DUF4126)
VNMHALALAYALSTLAGVRVSYPAAALALAVHSRILKPPQTMTWLHSDTILLIAIVVCIVEFIAHKLDWLETSLHYIHKILSPVVGGAAAYAVDPSQGVTGFLIAALGAGTAFAVHTLRATARATGTAFILGSVNPFASVVEDGLVVSAATTAFFSAQTTAWVVLIVTIGCWLLTYRSVPRHSRRRRARA